MESDGSEDDQSDAAEEFDDADDIPPNAEDISDSDEDLYERDIDELLNENVEDPSKKKYEAKNGLVWQSTPTYELGGLHSFRPLMENIRVDLPRGEPTRRESNYFSLLFTDRMIKK